MSDDTVNWIVWDLDFKSDKKLEFKLTLHLNPFSKTRMKPESKAKVTTRKPVAPQSILRLPRLAKSAKVTAHIVAIPEELATGH